MGTLDLRDFWLWALPCPVLALQPLHFCRVGLGQGRPVTLRAILVLAVTQEKVVCVGPEAAVLCSGWTGAWVKVAHLAATLSPEREESA